MLRLARDQNETIIIDSDIKKTVLTDSQVQVSFGIEAPDDVEIWRKEIYEKIYWTKAELY